MTTPTNSGDSAALKLLTSNAMRTTLSRLIPQFERESGHSVSIAYDLADVIAQRVLEGEAGDVVLVNAEAITELVKNGRVAAGSQATLAQAGVGVAVRAGAPRPDIGNVDALRHALLAAKSIAYTSAGASGIYFARLIERLGITAEVKAKAFTRPSGIIGKYVADGSAEIAIQHVPQLLEVSGIDYLGPLPQELQKSTVVAAGILTQTTQPAAAQALFGFLASPAGAQHFKATGYDIDNPQTP